MTDYQKLLQFLDFISVMEPCRVCGSKVFLVDGDLAEKVYWLLCAGRDCVETRPIPEGFCVVEDCEAK
jgi:hypothetical protein